MNEHEELQKIYNEYEELAKEYTYTINNLSSQYDRVIEHIFDCMEHDGIVCLNHGCPNCDLDDDGACHGSCPSREELKQFMINAALGLNRR